MAPQNSLATSTLVDGTKLKEKLDTVAAQIEEVRRQRELLAPKKEKKTYTKKIDHSKKPKKSFTHPNLDYVYGEVAHSPYLTKPLDPYPESTFHVVEELRELKRKGVKKISKLPKDKQPYDPKEIKNIFINDVINYQVSFLPKGYEDMKQREMELSQSMSQLDVSNIMGDEDGRGRERSHSPNMTEKRSQILLRNIARGGPAKYMKELKALKETREKTNLDDMAQAMMSVEDEKFFRSQRKEKARLHRMKTMEGEKFRRRAAEEGIRGAKATAHRIFEMTVPENIRSERVSSPPRLLALRRREMEETRGSQRGRGRSPDWGASSTMPIPRSESPAPHTPAPEMRVPLEARPATTTATGASATFDNEVLMVDEVAEAEAEEQRKVKAAKKAKKKPVMEEEMPPQFVVTPMNAGDDDGVEDGGFFNFEDFGKIESEPSPFDEIAPDVAVFGSVEDNIDVLRESIGLPEEIDERIEDSVSAPNSRPNTSGAAGRPTTSNKDADGYRDRVGKSSGRGNRGSGPSNVLPAEQDYEDVFPDYDPDADSEEEQDHDHYAEVDFEAEGEGAGAGAGAGATDDEIMIGVGESNVQADMVAALEHVLHAEEEALESVAVSNVAADMAVATGEAGVATTNQEGEDTSGGLSFTDNLMALDKEVEDNDIEAMANASVAAGEAPAAGAAAGDTATAGAEATAAATTGAAVSGGGDAVAAADADADINSGISLTHSPSAAATTTDADADADAGADAAATGPTMDEDAPLTTAADSPIKMDGEAPDGAMKFEEQSQSFGGVPQVQTSAPTVPKIGAF